MDTTTALPQLRALARILWRTAGIAALRRGLPLYAAVFIVSLQLFAGPHAMEAAEPVGVARNSHAVRAGLLAAWVILALPIARAWLISPSAAFVRVFPVRWTAATALLAVGLVAVEAPWVVLWTAGGGVGAGVWAAFVAAGAHALLVGRRARLPEAAALALLLVAFVLGPGPQAALAIPAVLTGCRRAWIDGWGARVRRARARVFRGHAALALASSHLVSLIRRQPALLGRSLWLTAVGSGIAALALYNNEISDARRTTVVTLVALTPMTVFNALAITAALLRIERRARWLLDVTGTSHAARVAAGALAVATPALLLGLAHGALVAAVATPHARAWVGASVHGAAVAAAASLWARWADRGSGQDGGRFVTAALVTIVVVIAGGLWFDEAGFAVAVLIVAVIAALLPVPYQPASARSLAAADQD